MTPRVVAVGTASPAYEVTQDETKAFAHGFFRDSFRAIDRLLRAFDNTRIERRQLAQPLPWYREPHAFAEKNAVYCDCALQMAVEASTVALNRARLAPSDVGAVVFVSTTGIRTPSLDGPLMQQLGVRPTAVRLPVWGLGCGGGAAGLARAAELVRARSEPVLLVASEVCSATFMHGDRTKSNLIATALFGDGAAAAVLQPGGGGLEVLGSASRLLEDSEDVMGWTLEDEGLRVRFARSIPGIVRDVVPDFVAQSAAAVGLSAEALEHFILHPGGAKVLEAYAEVLNVSVERLATAYAVLRDHGNMSSPTVLFALERFMDEVEPDGKAGLLLGLGPGFSAEGVVVRWSPTTS
ncbi:MAG: 3-oxoacyl-[acyl-carrier-protein] synthase III C-terminal domain-containing protein [Myxococcota bacterium]